MRNGSTWQVIGSDNYETLVGTPPCGIVFSEWARANPASWAYLAPILIENDGWAVFITTPLGNNHCRTMLEMAKASPGWFAEVSTVTDTGAIPLDAIEQQRVEYGALYGIDGGDALIEQEYWCSFAAAILGAYFAKEIATAEREGRIGKVDVNPELPVHVSWDLGIADATALWCFQVEPPGIDKPMLRIVDYYEVSGEAMGHYVDWLNARGYKGTDILPQDGKVREFSTGRTRLGALYAMGRKPQLGMPHSLVDGINAARVTIAAAHFDAGRCAKGIEALRHYQAEWDEEARVYRKTPRHDWTSTPPTASAIWRWPGARRSYETTEPRREPKDFVLVAQPDGSLQGELHDVGRDQQEHAPEGNPAGRISGIEAVENGGSEAFKS